MAITDYYGHKQGTTYLEIFTVGNNGSERTVHRQLQDAEAYDTWHLSYYMKEVLEYRQLLSEMSLDFDQLPRREKNLLLYLLLACRPEIRDVLEVGSSLFELIDGFELVEKYCQSSKSSLPAVASSELRYIGVELSQMLSQASLAIHPSHSISLHQDITQMRQRCGVLYDRSVMNYALETSQEVADCINLSEIALMNLFVSKEGTFVSSRLGKALVYFSLAELLQHLTKPLYHLFGERSPGPFSGGEWSGGRSVVEGFFLCCDPEVADDFMTMAGRDKKVWEWFQEKEIKPREAGKLLE